MVQLLVRQIVYTIVRSNSRPTFYLWWKENLVKQRKVSRYFEHDWMENFLLSFMFLFTTNLVKSNHSLARIFFIFPKNIQNQTSNGFNTKLRRHWKDRKSIYQAREVSPFFATWLLSIYVKTVSKTVELTKLLKKLSLYQSGTSYNQ